MKSSNGGRVVSSSLAIFNCFSDIASFGSCAHVIGAGVQRRWRRRKSFQLVDRLDGREFGAKRDVIAGDGSEGGGEREIVSEWHSRKRAERVLQL